MREQLENLCLSMLIVGGFTPVLIAVILEPGDGLEVARYSVPVFLGGIALAVYLWRTRRSAADATGSTAP